MLAAKIFYQHLEEKNLIRELENIERCSHKHIVQFFSTCRIKKRSEKPVLIMELMETCLKRYCTKEKRSFQCIVTILIQVAKGLHYLHELDPMIIHRDLTARNVLLNGTEGTPNKLVAKIADFGLSRTVASTSMVTMTKLTATRHYVAPELETGHYNEKVDIFSFGHLMLVAGLGKEITGDLKRKHQSDGLVLPEFERRRDYLNDLQKKLKGETDHSSCNDFLKLIEKCLISVVFAERPSAFVIINELSQILERLSLNSSDYLAEIEDEYPDVN